MITVGLHVKNQSVSYGTDTYPRDDKGESFGVLKIGTAKGQITIYYHPEDRAELLTLARNCEILHDELAALAEAEKAAEAATVEIG